MKIAGNSISFLMGFFIYSLIEITARGYTHWTMALTGGLVLMTLYNISNREQTTLLKCCFAGALFITGIEFLVGVLVNIIFNWQVWDYSDVPFNIFGQICLPFTALWFLLCVPAFFLCRFLRLQLCKNSFL